MISHLYIWQDSRFSSKITCHPYFFKSPSMSQRKLYIFDLCHQLLFSSGRRSIVPGLSGILAGLLYRLNTFGVRRLKVTLSRPFGKRDEW